MSLVGLEDTIVALTLSLTTRRMLSKSLEMSLLEVWYKIIQGLSFQRIASLMCGNFILNILVQFAVVQEHKIR